MTARHWNLLASSSLIALILLGLAWELWLAPLRPGGSWLVLKIVPLLGALFGILRGKRYTHQWMSLLSLAYFTEGIVRATSDSSPSAQLALVYTLLSVALFLSCLFYSKLTAPSRLAQSR
ncbi:DUF2069 domain-containing protein [Methyloversatilis discipulorum]|uniref:DUF2069 domain-containing protein n=1 Tax=Methyloversatilis discipulorum TaxID=1119528 RepID=UPI0026EAD8D9|nr:DUF2069 domain-containing protein [Methyloversatilis discipulorum]MBV5286241.1 DUF2069 domain-containing protein [Methyloversatilis discipulorum]